MGLGRLSRSRTRSATVLDRLRDDLPGPLGTGAVELVGAVRGDRLPAAACERLLRPRHLPYPADGLAGDPVAAVLRLRSGRRLPAT